MCIATFLGEICKNTDALSHACISLKMEFSGVEKEHYLEIYKYIEEEKDFQIRF